MLSRQFRPPALHTCVVVVVLTHALTQALTHSLTHCSYSFIIHSFILSLIHSFTVIHLLTLFAVSSPTHHSLHTLSLTHSLTMQRLSSRFTRLPRLPRHSPHVLPPPHLHTPSHTHSHIRIPNRYLTACSYAQSPVSARHGHATPGHGHGHVHRVHSRYLTARAYAQSPASSSPSPSPGLFMVPGLQQPEDFNVLANRAIENCDKVSE